MKFFVMQNIDDKNMMTDINFKHTWQICRYVQYVSEHQKTLNIDSFFYESYKLPWFYFALMNWNAFLYSSTNRIWSFIVNIAAFVL